MAGFKTPVLGFLFNKVASLTAIFLWILCNFQESFLVEHVLATTSRMILFFPFLQISEVFILKWIYLVERW